MKRVTPVFWISLALVSLTISFMLAGNVLIDLAPEVNEQRFLARAAVAESLAVQFSKLAEREDTSTIKTTIRALVDRNEDIRSAALVRPNGILVAIAGDHRSHWVQPVGHRSTLDHIQVPIFDGDIVWGTLQVAFRPSESTTSWFTFGNPWVQFILFVAGAGFLGYFLFMKKTLRALDPSLVVPQRVKAALDVLSEGVVLQDLDGAMVLVNEAFARRLGRQPSSLIGKKLSDLGWRSPNPDGPSSEYPWDEARRERRPVTGTSLGLTAANGAASKFVVNSCPIIEDGERVRGVLSSFDDVTRLEQANAHLQDLVTELEASRARLTTQNHELERLATRDPLTDCLNRHTFLARLEQLFAKARAEGTELGCITVDINSLKSFNQRYGHAVGDQVINVVARTLSASLRPDDVLGRIGGEEFCILLPGLTAEQTTEVAKRLRRTIQEEGALALRSSLGVEIAATLGVSSVTFGATEAFGMINQAEQASAAGKLTRLDSVMRWDRLEQSEDGQAEEPSAAKARQELMAHG